MSNYLHHTAKSKVERFVFVNENKDNAMLFVKRDDLIHNEISGNKFRKLKFNIERAQRNNCEALVTYGGAYSNHLLAVASICKMEGFRSIAFVRGDELHKDSNKMLQRCFELGMELCFLPRSEYKNQKHRNEIALYNGQKALFIPEGGANREGVLGCSDIIFETDNNYDYIFVAQGTSTTSLGIYAGMSKNCKLVVVPVLKSYDSIKEMKLLSKLANITLDTSRLLVLDHYHFGGYAKSTQELDDFIKSFNALNQFQVEKVYTGKVLFAMHAFLSQILGRKKALFVHTGGLYNV